MNVDHSSREHSIWSSSAWEMWSRCPASALATKGIERTDSDASLRGTWMHEQAERLSRKLSIEKGSGYNTPDNLEQIQRAVDFVEQAEIQMVEDSEMFLEQRVDLGGWGHSDVYGTADVILYNEHTGMLHVIDYKFGHTPVKVEDNGQLRIYALGAIGFLEDRNRFTSTVKISIVQPMTKAGIYTDVLSADELKRWGKEVLLPAIQKAKDPNAPFLPGEKQCKWCPLSLSSSCEAQTGRVLSIFDQYKEKEDLEPDELGALLPELDLMEMWIAAKRTLALTTLERGGDVAGYKLVRKITRRKWMDEEKAEKWLAARKIPKEERTVTKVISISQAEKKLRGVLKDNAILTRNFEKLITRPTGVTTMAPLDDSREAVIVQADPLTDEFMI